ncbi:hypothetical protein BLOT_010328 [Blomia tropicalis]|nr:hypothetical protein BLOT_010328 [Blomia tropicalis]
MKEEKNNPNGMPNTPTSEINSINNIVNIDSHLYPNLTIISLALFMFTCTKACTFERRQLYIDDDVNIEKIVSICNENMSTTFTDGLNVLFTSPKSSFPVSQKSLLLIVKIKQSNSIANNQFSILVNLRE